MSGQDLQALTRAQIKTKATLDYLKDLDRYRSEKPYTLALDIQLEDEKLRTNLEYELRTVELYNLRGFEDDVSLELHGFELKTIPPHMMEKYFHNTKEDSDLEGVIQLFKEKFQTNNVFVYDRAVRKPLTLDSPSLVLRHWTNAFLTSISVEQKGRFVSRRLYSESRLEDFPPSE